MKPNTVVMGFYDDDPPQDEFVKCQVYGRTPQQHDDDDDEDANIINQFPPLRTPDHDKILSPTEYVKIIADCIRLGKNVCVTRYFHELDRDQISAGGKKEPTFVDVWPVNFFKPETAAYLDTACIFLLQLACVLHMVPTWSKNTKLRVFLCIDLDESVNNDRRNKLGSFLHELRIKAEIISVPWQNAISLKHQGAGGMGAGAASRVELGIDEDDEELLSASHQQQLPYITHISADYIHALNLLVKRYTRKTSVLFCYLPLPSASADERDHSHYLQLLDSLTQSFPPTVLVHGIQEVTTMAL